MNIYHTDKNILIRYPKMVKRTHRHVFQLHGDVESCEVTKWLFILNKRTNMLILCVVHEEQKYNAQITYCKQAQKPLNLTNNALMNQASFHEHCGSRGKADLLSFPLCTVHKCTITFAHKFIKT